MVVAVVIGGHVAVLALFAIHHGPDIGQSDDERMTLVFIDPVDATSRPRPIEALARPPATRHPMSVRPAPAAPPPPADSNAITVPDPAPGIDWYAHGTDAAQRAAAEPTTRGFGFPKREPAPREKKEFAWDKTHTERVHALEGGGIGIHLSDNCELMIAPFPIAGCALGKRKARGDLFDEMKAPVEPGDWKDR
jgi:hypothetical protein